MALDTLLERELGDLRIREADYRSRLERHRMLAHKLRKHASRLRETLRDLGPHGRAERLLFEVARLSSQALEIPRASVWLFEDDRRFLVRRLALPASAGEQPQHRLPTGAISGYLRALESTETGAVAVDDALTDTRTSELCDYLRANDVRALLDVPLVGPGALRGVLCFEHQGEARVWQEEEIDFAADVGALAALALEVERRDSLERTLRGSEARYQHLVESLPVVVYSFDARSGTLDYLSPHVVGLSGRHAEEYLVSGGIERWLQAIEPGDRESVQKRLASKLSDQIEPELVYRVRLADGSRRWVRDTCSVVRDAKGSPVAVQGTLADITVQKESELAHAELQARHRELLENIDLPAVILDVTGRLEFINDCFLKLTGVERSEAIGADAFALLLPENESERVRSEFVAAIAAGKLLSRFETRVRTRAGTERKILWTNSLVRGTGGEVVGCSSLGVDITERLEAETLTLQLEKLESLGRLAAGVAHDFNNLLAVIQGAADLLHADVPPEHAAPLAEIQLAVTQAAALTRALLAYARREVIQPAVVKPDLVVESTLPLLVRMTGPSLSFTHHLGADLEVVIDPAQLRQVILNLVGNAVDATLGHGTSVRLTTEVVALDDDVLRARGLTGQATFWVLVVSDDGRGMSAVELERAFDPFFTTKEKKGGSGLGLALSSSIVRRAGGFMSAVSTKGSGATFRVHLPVVEGDSERGRSRAVRTARST